MVQYIEIDGERQVRLYSTLYPHMRPEWKTCGKCNGSGYLSWTRYQGAVCFDCHGTGQVRRHPECTVLGCELDRYIAINCLEDGDVEHPYCPIHMCLGIGNSECVASAVQSLRGIHDDPMEVLYEAQA